MTIVKQDTHATPVTPGASGTGAPTDDGAALSHAPEAVKDRRRGLLTKVLKIVIPFAVSVGLCWILFKDIDPAEVVEVVRSQCDFRFIALNLALGVGAMVFRAMRWGIQLRAIGVRAPLHILCYSIFGTYAVNLLFPRLGEVWRSGYIAYRQRAGFSEVFGSMVADRLADTLTVMLLSAATLLIAYGPIADFVRTYPDAYRRLAELASSPWLWAGIVAVIGGTWIFFKYVRNPLTRKIRQFIKGFWGGFASIVSMNHKGRWLLLTALIWGCYYMQLYVAFFAFPFTREIIGMHGATAVLVCLVLTSISMGVPSNGGIGPYQITMIFALRIFAPAAMLATAGARETFQVNAAAFGNLLIGVQTILLVALGIVTAILIAADKRKTRRMGAHETDRPQPDSRPAHP